MRTARRRDGWYIEGVPEYETGGEVLTEYGPYATKAEAEESRRGVMRTLRSMGLDPHRFPHRPARRVGEDPAVAAVQRQAAEPAGTRVQRKLF